ncbi:MAG: phage integrase N-terminal SAM-like domain-containing protein [SAR324 cluster bacterium]|nr:phage integrase N-terminal SAM-like domain-containing protein [SAR324 cluster bacterium]
MSPKTISCYSLALRRVADYFDRCPDDLTQDELKIYFSDLVDSHSWSTVKIDRNGLQFFFKHVLKQDWNREDCVSLFLLNSFQVKAELCPQSAQLR